MGQNPINENDDLQKAINDINKIDERDSSADFAAGMVAKFAEQMKAVPDNNSQQNLDDVDYSLGQKESSDVQLREVKVAAMHDLVPLMDKLDIDAEDKFELFAEMFEVLNDNSIVNKMHNTARMIADDAAKAKALFKVVELLKKF